MEEYKFYGKIHVDWVDPDQVYYYNENYWCDELSDHDATAFLNEVNQAIEKECDEPHWKDKGNFMEYFWVDESEVSKTIAAKVKSAYLKAEIHNDVLYSVMTCKASDPLTESEIQELKDEFTGQYSDGFGESLEQREVKIGNGEIFIKLWTPDDFKLMTEQEFLQKPDNGFNLQM